MATQYIQRNPKGNREAVELTHSTYREMSEDLRLLTKYETDTQNRLRLLFVGLTELKQRLQMSVHESLDQRIVVSYPG